MRIRDLKYSEVLQTAKDRDVLGMQMFNCHMKRNLTIGDVTELSSSMTIMYIFRTSKY